MLPLVSIGIPTFNRPKGLRRVLECISGQTYENLEIIISDNCSDNPLVQEVLKVFQEKDRRVNFIIHSENKGALFNFHFLLEQATGDYFMWAADDDWWDTQFVERAVAALEKNTNAVACWSDVLFHSEDNGMVWPKPYDRYTNPDLSSDNKVRVLLKYHLQYGWYGFYALFRRNKITNIFSSYFVDQSIVFGSDVHFITKVLLTGNILKLHKPFFHYSVRKESSVNYHLNRLPFGELSKKNPYLAQLLETFKIVMHSESLSIFEKLSYYGQFLFSVLFKASSWTSSIRRYPSTDFYCTILYRGKIKELFLLLPFEVTVSVRKVLRKTVRVIHFTGLVFYQIAKIIKFTLYLPTRPRVLIIEPNVCHAELLAGIGNYLNILGYNCQFLVSDEIGKENPFCRTNKRFFSIHYLKYSIIIKIISSKFLSLYDFAFLNSTFDYRKKCPFTEIYRLQHKPKNGMLFIEHNLHNVIADNSRLYQAYKAKRLLTLTNYHKDKKLTEIVPCFFGDIKIKEKKGNPVIILVPGTNSQDVDLLILTVKNLVNKGYRNFELHVIGTTANKEVRKHAEDMGVDDYIKILGRVNFPTLYHEIETSDFLVAPQGNGYLNRKTSGSKQLSLGFTTPLIVTKEIAAAWGFNEYNSINYSATQGFPNAMEHALLMREEEYRLLVNSLHENRTILEKKSLLNLRKLLSEIALTSTNSRT